MENNITDKIIKVKTISFSFTDESLEPYIISTVGLSENTLECISNIIKESYNEQ